MEIWELYKILQSNGRWPFQRKSLIQNKINALKQFAVHGTPHEIIGLTQYLRHGNPEIREQAIQTIVILFNKLDLKTGYYNTLRSCYLSTDDLDFYAKSFSKEQVNILLAIASMNGNGYVREKAVKRLATVNEAFAIPFILYRLADWAKAVHLAAAKAIQNYRAEQFIDELANHLTTLEDLQRVQRVDLSGVYADVLNFVASTNRSYVIDRFKTYSTKTRQILAKHFSNFPIDYGMERSLILSDKDPIVRQLALDGLHIENKKEIAQLLADGNPFVRLQTLYRLKNAGVLQQYIVPFLADSSASIRSLAQYSLKQTGINLSDYYCDNLNENRQIVGSLAGLAEIDAKEHWALVERFLQDSIPRIKTAAFLALRKLNPDAVLSFALQNFVTTRGKLGNAIIDFLSKKQTEEMLIAARSAYSTGDYDQRKWMLKLFAKTGGWAVLPDIMIGTVDESKNIRYTAYDYLIQWKVRANRLFITPAAKDLERAKRVFAMASELHDQKNYFDRNPLSGIDFYLR